MWLPLVHVPLAGDLACNTGMCPGWESTQGHFGSPAGTQSTEPYQPGHISKAFDEHSCMCFSKNSFSDLYLSKIIQECFCLYAQNFEIF